MADGVNKSYQSWVGQLHPDARLNLYLLIGHKHVCCYNKPTGVLGWHDAAQITVNHTLKMCDIQLTLCWKKDGSRYLSNLSSNFTSDFFHFTCIGKMFIVRLIYSLVFKSISCLRDPSYMRSILQVHIKKTENEYEHLKRTTQWIIQYSQNKTLQFLCWARVWLCLHLSDLHRQFCCH